MGNGLVKLGKSGYETRQETFCTGIEQKVEKLFYRDFAKFLIKNECTPSLSSSSGGFSLKLCETVESR